MNYFTSAQKAEIIRRHIDDNMPLAVLADEYGVGPAVLYKWKRRLAETAVNERLLESELITRSQLRRALVYQRIHGGASVGALIELGFLTPETFVRFMAGQPGVPSLKLRQYDIKKSTARLVPRNFALERLALPVDRLGKLLTVAMACPLDEDTVRDISRMTDLKAKQVLATRADILWAIERFLPDEDASTPSSEAQAPRPAPDTARSSHPVPEEEIRRIIKQISTLPLLPSSIHLLHQLVKSGDVSQDSLLRLVRTDSLMVARLLALANSEAANQSGQVCSHREAIEFLGVEKAIMLLSAADSGYEFGHWEHFDFQEYWTDAVCCATAAELVAKHLGIGRLDDFYTAGLLHDIGRIVLHEALPLNYRLIERQLTGLKLLVQEAELVGMPHSTAGYELARHWRLPEEFAESIRFHHFPERARGFSDFAAVVSIANVMADRARIATVMQESDLSDCRGAMKLLNLEAAAILNIFEDFVKKIPLLFSEDGGGLTPPKKSTA